MGWVNRIPLPHTECPLPSTEVAAAGSVWKCDECGTVWRIIENERKHVEVSAGYRGIPWNEIHRDWEKVGGPEWLVV